MFSNAKKLFNIYNRCLVKHRYRVQAVQISLLMGFGDVIAQKVISETDYDPKRTLRFMSLGLILGPLTERWFMQIDKIFGSEMSFHNGIKKACVDQMFGNPVYLAIVLGGLPIIEGKGVEGIKQNFKDEYIDVLLASYMVWPFVQVLNFALVPSHYRVLQLQVVEVCWNTYLSWKTHQKSKETT